MERFAHLPTAYHGARDPFLACLLGNAKVKFLHFTRYATPIKNTPNNEGILKKV